MRLVTFQRNIGAEPGVISGENVVGLKGAGFSTLLAVIEAGPDALRTVEAWLENPPANEIVPLAGVRLLAPLPRPPKIICVGLNYRDHVIECNAEIPKVPTIFSKYPTAVIGPCDAIVLPKHSTAPDYEAELAVIIGKGGRHIPRARWRFHVFGYTNFKAAVIFRGPAGAITSSDIPILMMSVRATTRRPPVSG
jgi:2-keto-4-pentenoate hydratase/2-oxohepta-3-ene-1,7-dioic acid hydratase in catechol pathway